MAAKYFPGHSLALALGALLGAPGLVPIALAGLSGGVLFSLAWRLGGARTAVLSWLLWLAAPLNVRFLPTYFSETTSTAAWLLAWWALVGWRRSGGYGRLLAVAAAVGWCGITRPLTGIALAIPTVVTLLATLRSRRRWGEVAGAIAVGGAILALVPMWSQRTTGSWRETPVALYTRQYLPWDRMGFGLDSTPATRTGSPDMERYAERFRRMHRFNLPSNLPLIAAARLAALGEAIWGPALLVGLPLALFGAWRGPWAARFGLVTAGLLFLAYLGYVHALFWNVYYLEMVPGLALCTAIGAESAARAARDRGRGLLLGILLGGGVAFLWSTDQAVERRAEARNAQSYYARFARQIDSIPGPAVVLVRYGPHHDPERFLLRNSALGIRSRLLVAHDLGEHTAALRALLPGRAFYRFDESTGTLTPLGHVP